MDRTAKTGIVLTLAWLVGAIALVAVWYFFGGC